MNREKIAELTTQIVTSTIAKDDKKAWNTPEINDTFNSLFCQYLLKS